MNIHELIGELSEERWPSPEIVEQIIAAGQEAVAPLIEIVNRAAANPEASPVADFAMGILGDLKTKEAVPALLQYIRTGDEDLIDYATDALVSIRDVPLADIEALVRDGSLHWYRRATARRIYRAVAPKEQAIALFREFLDDFTRRADVLDEQDYVSAATLSRWLAELAGREAKPWIDAAFAAGAIDLEYLTPRDIEKLYKEPPEPYESSTFLEAYRLRYEDEQEEEEEGDEAFDEDDDDEELDLPEGWDRKK